MKTRRRVKKRKRQRESGLKNNSIKDRRCMLFYKLTNIKNKIYSQ